MAYGLGAFSHRGSRRVSQLTGKSREENRSGSGQDLNPKGCPHWFADSNKIPLLVFPILSIMPRHFTPSWNKPSHEVRTLMIDSSQEMLPQTHQGLEICLTSLHGNSQFSQSRAAKTILAYFLVSCA